MIPMAIGIVLDSYRDFVVADSLVLPCLPAGREIANFL